MNGLAVVPEGVTLSPPLEGEVGRNLGNQGFCRGSQWSVFRSKDGMSRIELGSPARLSQVVTKTRRNYPQLFEIDQ